MNHECDCKTESGCECENVSGSVKVDVEYGSERVSGDDGASGDGENNTMSVSGSLDDFVQNTSSGDNERAMREGLDDDSTCMMEEQIPQLTGDGDRPRFSKYSIKLGTDPKIS